MQQPPYPNYGQYYYPVYPQGSQQYSQYYPQPQPSQPPHAPHTNHPPAPAPYSFDAAAYNLKPNPSLTAPPRRHRKNSSTPATAPAQIKSAMKRTVNAFSQAEATIGRQISNPFYNPAAAQPNPNPAMQMPRPRTYSNPAYPENIKDDPREQEKQPVLHYHMMVSFVGYNELRIEQVMKKALDDLRSLIWPIWKDGVESDTVQGSNCIVKFRNNPWDMNGPNLRQAYQLIAAFFRLFQDKGYSFQTAVSISTPSPRLLFQVTRPDPNAFFFVAYFDHDGTRFNLIEPPTQIDLSFVSRLRSSFPHSTLNVKPIEDHMRVVEVRKKFNSNVPEVEPSLLFVEILQIFSDLNFQLDAAIPFGRKGALGMRSSPRELLVFKGSLPT